MWLACAGATQRSEVMAPYLLTIALAAGARDGVLGSGWREEWVSSRVEARVCSETGNRCVGKSGRRRGLLCGRRCEPANESRRAVAASPANAVSLSVVFPALAGLPYTCTGRT